MTDLCSCWALLEVEFPDGGPNGRIAHRHIQADWPLSGYVSANND